jgi:hypothetical protein
VRFKEEIAVAKHDTLGTTGSARRVDDGGHVLRLDDRHGDNIVARLGEAFEGQRMFIDFPMFEPNRLLNTGYGSLNFPEHTLGRKQETASWPAYLRIYLASLLIRIDRHNASSGSQDRLEGNDPFEAVLGADCDSVPTP